MMTDIDLHAHHSKWGREVDYTVTRSPERSYMKTLTPQLIAVWEEKLRDPQEVTSAQKYTLERRISDIEGTLPTLEGVVRKVALVQLHEAECKLEAYTQPVPVRASTMPTWQGKEQNDYTDIPLSALEVAHAHVMGRITKGLHVIAKTLKDYNRRGELITAGVWDWNAPLFTCPPKGSIKAYFAVLFGTKSEGNILGTTGLMSEANLLEREIATREYLQGRETPDNITQWNTSGTCGPTAGEDTRRFPELTGNLSWFDMGDMAQPSTKYVPQLHLTTKDYMVVCGAPDDYTLPPVGEEEPMCEDPTLEVLRWHNRINGKNFTTPAEIEVEVTF